MSTFATTEILRGIIVGKIGARIDDTKKISGADFYIVPSRIRRKRTADQDGTFYLKEIHMKKLNRSRPKVKPTDTLPTYDSIVLENQKKMPPKAKLTAWFSFLSNKKK